MSPPKHQYQALVNGGVGAPSTATPHPHPSTAAKTPWFAWPLLIAAVFAVSSAATAFTKMQEVPALTLAAWRLQLTSVILAVLAAWQWRGMDAELRGRTLRSAGLLAGSGACLAVHFGAWVWGLQHTSLTHSLLAVSATPVLLAACSLLLRQPISAGEVAGALLGLAGACVLAFTASQHASTNTMSTSAAGSAQSVPQSTTALSPHATKPNEPSLAGDAASLLAAVVFVGYLHAGRTLRQFMPVFVYACPITSFAAAILTLSGMLFEGSSLLGIGSAGACGWLASGRHAPWVVYLALGPGLVGHTGFNALLKYLTPLTVSLAFQLEPLVGSAIGWLAGVMLAPGSGTLLGGGLVLLATLWVTAASSAREAREATLQTHMQDGGTSPATCSGSSSSDALGVCAGNSAGKTLSSNGYGCPSRFSEDGELRPWQYDSWSFSGLWRREANVLEHDRHGQPVQRPSFWGRVQGVLGRRAGIGGGYELTSLGESSPHAGQREGAGQGAGIGQIVGMGRRDNGSVVHVHGIGTERHRHASPDMHGQAGDSGAVACVVDTSTPGWQQASVEDEGKGLLHVRH